MRSTTIKTIAFSAMYLALNSVYAQLKSGDSVIEPDFDAINAQMREQQGKVKADAYKPQSQVEIDNKLCPSGFRGSDGGSTYKSRQRLVSRMYETNYVARTIAGPWQDLDDYCNRTQSQKIDCPSGQEGYRTQTKTDTFDNSGYSYGNWSTTSRNCSPIPPPPVYNPPPVYTPPVYTPPVYTPPVTVNPPPVIPPPPAVICTESSYHDSFACPSGYTGAQYQSTYVQCPNGPYRAGVTSKGPVDSSDCKPVYVSPPPVYVPPTPSGCPLAYGGYASVGSVRGFCDVFSGRAYPRGQNFKCMSGGWWAENNRGHQIETVVCE